jgi:hypothetical protein
MAAMATKAVVKDDTGTVFYEQAHNWAVLEAPGQAALADMLDKQTKFLADLKAKQNKTPDAIYSAVMSATGMPDLTYDAFTYDMFQKSLHSWNQGIEEVFRLGEKPFTGKGKP